jgi:pyruvate formate lyase activating enzyme
MICGLQKMTLLDFPGKIACTAFLGGCNFRCPFCHNSELFTGKPEKLMEDDAFFAFLSKRKGLLDGVCVSGGEPTLYKDLPAFLGKIKELGFLVKLDTNGSRPEVLKTVVQAGLVDYVAMDIKNSPAGYPETIGLKKADMDAVAESAAFLMEGNIGYEFRTTVVKQLHSEESIEEMGRWLSSLVPGKKPEKLFLQSFVDRDTVCFSGLEAPEEDTLARYVELLTPYIGQVTLRGT